MAAPAIGHALILRLELPSSRVGNAVARAVAAAATESGIARRAAAVAEGEELTATV